ncbi:hypothetical protein V2G26_016800 [Clonostachys chloroleuca]
MAELVDPTQKGNYPVILGDSLLGKNSNEIFTGVRYNHKPPIATAEKNPARLKPSISGDKSSYDLNFVDKVGHTEYAYAGARNTDDGQYVLYFDPAREAFILDRIDSTLNMNITRTPNNSDPASLRRQYPQLDRDGKTAQSSGTSESSKPQQTKAPKAKKKDPPARKSEPKAKPKAAPAPAPKPKSQGLVLPQAQQVPPKPKSRSRTLEEEEEEDDDDDDGGLLVEYPGGEPRSQKRDFSPAFPAVRRFDDFMDQRESEADDADGESEDEGDVDFKLPSPVNHHQNTYGGQMEEEEESEPEMEEVEPQAPEYEQEDSLDIEDDLEKDLEMAFEEVNVEDKGEESEISEED